LRASRYVHDVCASAALAVGREHACGLENLQHFESLPNRSGLQRHLVTLAFAHHRPTQRGLAADDLNKLWATDRLHAATTRAEKELLLLAVGIDQADQRAELYAFDSVVGGWNLRQVAIAWRMAAARRAWPAAR
jgi:hypothetical protein